MILGAPDAAGSKHTNIPGFSGLLLQEGGDRKDNEQVNYMEC